MTTHQPYAFSLNNTLISAVSRQSVTPQSTISNDVHAGSPYAKSTTINAQSNQATMTTFDLVKALALLGSEGVKIDTGGAKLYQIELDPLTGLPETTAVHRYLSMARGKVVPVRMSCEHQRDAELEMLVHAVVNPATFVASELETYPIVVTEDTALPTGLEGDKRWTLAKTKVAGVTLDCSLNVSIDFGINITTEGCQSNIFDSTVVIAEIKPVIRIRGKNLKKFHEDAIPAKGKACTHANTEIFLRQRLTDEAGFGLPTEPSHIKFTADGIAHWTTYHDAQNNNRLENELQIDCRHDGTDVGLVVATSVVMEEA
ncbi:MAG: hypothetical protein WBD31_13670 [Rubripirellula sp.]